MWREERRHEREQMAGKSGKEQDGVKTAPERNLDQTEQKGLKFTSGNRLQVGQTHK